MLVAMAEQSHRAMTVGAYLDMCFCCLKQKVKLTTVFPSIFVAAWRNHKRSLFAHLR